MPNTLGHLCVQGLATRGLIRGADLRWIALGCVVPDVAWILHLMLRAVTPDGLDYDLRLYAMAQSSLAACLLLSAALSCFAGEPRRVLAILTLNSVLHLLLDACQTKWGNGVHLMAPFSWRMLNFELFWPESAFNVALTVAGGVYICLAGWRWPGRFIRLRLLPSRRTALGALLLLAYLLLPIAFLSGPERADNHSIAVLRGAEERAGRQVAFDRVSYERRASGGRLRTFAGERLEVAGPPRMESGTISARGRFLDASTVELGEVHRHWPQLRDLASYLGLAAIAALWIARRGPSGGAEERRSGSG